MKPLSELGLQAPSILIPKKTVDLSKWAVVACDQYTSQPGYWRKVEDLVAENPSTFHLILPEAYLGTPKEEQHAAQVQDHMQTYLQHGIFREVNGFILVKRIFDDVTRFGLMAALDLEAYDYASDSQSLIRATEGTIVDRLPPRIAIREKAELEIPHILVLIDDPEKTVIEPLAEQVKKSDLLYDFDLMQHSGHLTGSLIDPKHHDQIASALETLRSPRVQTEKYGTDMDIPPMLYAMGDGNHSLATAKAIWEKKKATLPHDHPSRYALVEIVNLHDPGIEFEAIHRLLIHPTRDLEKSAEMFFDGDIKFESVPDYNTLIDRVDNNEDIQRFGLFNAEGYIIASLSKPKHTLTVGNVQPWVDQLISDTHIGEVDYIHGAETIHKLGQQDDHAGIYLPVMEKDTLFRSVIKDGPLPRKTFSMGEAHQKRFYLECRRIK